MIRQEPFSRDEILPSWFVNRIQDRLAPLVQLRLEQTNATTIQSTAGANDEASSLNVAGNWRFIEATVTRAHPGGTAGTYLIFAVAKAQDIDATPDPNTDNTDYAYDLRIVSNATTPAIEAGVVDIYRRIGSLVWDGAAITSITQEVGATRGPVGVVGGDLAGSLPNPTVGPFPAGRVLSWGGDTNLYRSAAGVLKTDGTLQVTESAYTRLGTSSQIILTDAGGLPIIFFGPANDTNLYRNAANVLRTDDEFWAAGGLRLADGLYTVNGVAPGSLQLASAGDITFLQGGVKQHWMNGVNLLFGPAGDTNLYRAAAATLKTDGNLRVVGHLGAQRVVVGLAGADTAGLTGYTAAFESRNYASSIAFLATDEAAPTYPKFRIDNNGHLRWGPGGGTDVDTELHRNSAGALATGGQVIVGSALTTYEGTTARIQTGNASGVPTIYMGLAADTLIQRLAAGRVGMQGLDLSGSLKRPVVTALPGSPYDGQEVLFQTAAMASAGVGPWLCRYDSTLSGTSKWRVIGPDPMRANVDANESTGSTTPVHLTTTLSLLLPVAGDYDVAHGCRITFGAASGFGSSYGGRAYLYANATSLGSDIYVHHEPQPDRAITQPSRTARLLGRAAGDVLSVRYAALIAGTTAFGERYIEARPLRIG